MDMYRLYSSRKYIFKLICIHKFCWPTSLKIAKVLDIGLRTFSEKSR